MSRALKTLAALSVAAILATGCAQDDDPESSPAASGDGAITSEHVTFGEQAGQVRGHHIAANALFEAGDTDGAVTHTGHPVDEILASLKPEVAEEDEALADSLDAAFRAPGQVVADGGTPDELKEATDEAAEVVADAEAAVVGDEVVETTAYKASVISALLATVVGEYTEAVKDGKVVLTAEFQDAYAFTAEAKRMYDDIVGDVTAVSEEEAEEIAEAWASLDAALPGVTPPAALKELADVEGPARQIGAELNETVGAVLVEQVDPEDAFDNIDALLGEIVTAVKAGNTDEAAELAAELYLENYELIEADVIELAPEVNSDLEPLLGTLRREIEDGLSGTELDEAVAEARRLLAQAREVVLAAHAEEDH